MTPSMDCITYTLTDEAPALATHSLLPIIKAFLKVAGLRVETADISLSARTIAAFPDFLKEQQRVPDFLTQLGKQVQDPSANIIKLPNISASLPQLEAAIDELRGKDYELPPYHSQRNRYNKVLGSAVNPILREGNSDRRVAPPVKAYARKYPHSLGPWSQDIRSHVASMEKGDFYSSERSFLTSQSMAISIRWRGKKGETKILKEKVNLQKGDLVDGATMSCRCLKEYYQREMDRAKQQNLLLSLHLKATMMKVSDPIIFSHGVETYYRETFQTYREDFDRLQVNTRKGLGELLSKLEDLPPEKRKEIQRAMEKEKQNRPPLAMVDSHKGVTNLHVPNDVIIDASMPSMIRNSGKMWDSEGELQETKALIPDRCYGGIYQEVIDFCRTHGAFSVSTMGNVSNVGLMARKAEEYGSHDKTFEIEKEGVVEVLDPQGEVLLKHPVEKGDLWRMCQTQGEAIRDWVSLGVRRAGETGLPGFFWLDSSRSHDKTLISLVERYLSEQDTTDITLSILSPVKAMRKTLERVAKGQDTISITGNVLRDYLTDLFPIMELGTSAKMLSLVPLLKGGGLYETGAGGSAPRHVQQFIKENHLRWDSLGEFLALGVSLQDLARKNKDKRELLEDLAETLERATGRFLDKNKSPSPKLGERDTRGSHFYWAFYWAQALGEKSRSPQLRHPFKTLSTELSQREKAINEELLKVQGQPVDLGGYYLPDPQKASQAMRPSPTFNSLIESLSPVSL